MRSPFRGRRRLLILAAVAAGLAGATFLAMHYGIPYKRHWAIQHHLAAFRADPSRENLVPLAEVMAAGPVSREDAQEVAQAVLGLKVEARKSYRPAAPIDVMLVPRNEDLLRRQDPPDNDAAVHFLNWRLTLRISGQHVAEGEETQWDYAPESRGGFYPTGFPSPGSLLDFLRFAKSSSRSFTVHSLTRPVPTPPPLCSGPKWPRWGEAWAFPSAHWSSMAVPLLTTSAPRMSSPSRRARNRASLTGGSSGWV